MFKPNLHYSVIIPAYNEEKLLGKTLEALKTAMENRKEQGEVIVVDNNSTDRTAEIPAQHGTRVVFEPHNQISQARNAGAKTAQGRYLVFLDADTIISEKLLHKALENLAGGTCAGGGGFVAMDRPVGWFSGTMLNFWLWLARKYNLAAGCFIYCLKEAFDDIGGFSEKVYCGEELWFSRHMNTWAKEHGMSFTIIEDPPITTSGRKLDHPWILAAATLFGIVFPFMPRFRCLSFFWYKRF